MEIKELLTQLNHTKASDLLLVAGSSICLRINSSLQAMTKEKLTGEMIEKLIAPIIRKEELEEFSKLKELDTSYEDEMSRYRINLHYQRGTVAATIRRIPKEIPTIDQLGLPAIIKNFTTLESHIITIEDPIEFVHTSKMSVLEQREVGFDTHSFKEALKRVLRQIPDVILVGEMRDLESIQMAITAAETGHLVISTLHTQDSVQSIDRMVDVFPPHQQEQIRSMLALTLQGIVCQQLIPKIDGKGLVLAMEILIATPAIRNIIRKGSTTDIYSMIELGSQFGMVSMDNSLANLFKKGLISKEEAIIYAINRERLEKKLSGTA